MCKKRPRPASGNVKVRGVGVGGWWPTTGTLAGYGAARLEGYLARVAVGISHCANVCVYEVRVFFFRPGRDSAGADSPRHRHSTEKHPVVCRMDRTHLRARYRTWKVL